MKRTVIKGNLAFLCIIAVSTKSEEIMHEAKHSFSLQDAVLFFAVLALTVVFYRHMIFDSNNIVGDWGGARLGSLVMENWYGVFSGEAARDTLGFSDAMFIPALPYSVLRAFGVSWPTAFQSTLILLHFFGGLCLAWILKNILKLPIWACIIGLIIGMFSNSFYISITNVQFIANSLLPLLFILLYKFYSSFSLGMNIRRRVFGVSSVVLFAGIMLSSFYTAFFAALFLFVLHVFFAVVLLKFKTVAIKQALSAVKTYWWEPILYVVAAFAAFAPVVWIYRFYVVLKRGQWSQTRESLPFWYDFFNVSPTNLVWGFWQFNRNLGGELSVGYPLITAILLILGCVFFIRRIHLPSGSQSKKLHVCLVGFSFAVILLSLFALRIGDFSLWYIIWEIIPFASVVRVPVGINLFLSLPAGIIIACFLSEKISSVHVQKGFTLGSIRFGQSELCGLICLVLISVVFLEHQNTWENTRWTKTEVQEYLNQMIPPPEGAETFLSVGEVVPLTSRSMFQGNGWANPEPWGTWTEGTRAVLAMKTDSVSNLLLRLNISNVLSYDPIDVYVNNNLVESFVFEEGINEIRIPKELYPERQLIIVFRIRNPQVPHYLDGRGDMRRLGISVASFYIIED